MTRTERLATELLKPLNPSLIVVLGFYTILWGLWIVSPFWSVFNAAPLYSTLASVSSEVVWGSLAVLAGVCVTYGAYRPSRVNLQFGSFVGALHWFIIALFYFIADWTSTGGISALAFAVYSGIVWVNVKMNGAYYDAQVAKRPL